MTPSNDSNFMTIEQAMLLLNLTEPFSHDTLQERYEEARRVWYPSRYAGLTNNPAKYMEMYKKGEAKTKEVHAAYQILSNHLLNSRPSRQQDDHGAA